MPLIDLIRGESLRSLIADIGDFVLVKDRRSSIVLLIIEDHSVGDAP